MKDFLIYCGVALLANALCTFCLHHCKPLENRLERIGSSKPHWVIGCISLFLKVLLAVLLNLLFGCFLPDDDASGLAIAIAIGLDNPLYQRAMHPASPKAEASANTSKKG